MCFTLRRKGPYLELFLSAFSHIWTECGEIRSISPYSVILRENADQYNSEYGHFLRNVRPFVFSFFIETFIFAVSFRDIWR